LTETDTSLHCARRCHEKTCGDGVDSADDHLARATLSFSPFSPTAWRSLLAVAAAVAAMAAAPAALRYAALKT